MLKKALLSLVALGVIGGGIQAETISANGMSQKALYNYLSNTKTAVNQLKSKARSCTLKGGTLRMDQGTTSNVVEIQNQAIWIADGVLCTKDAGSNVPTASNTTVGLNKWNVFVFTGDSSSTLAVQAGTQASTLAGVAFPAVTNTKAILGMLIVNPVTATFNFGATSLNAAGLNQVFFDTTGAFDLTGSSGDLSLSGL